MFSIQDLLARRSIPGLKQSEDRRIIAEELTSVLGVEVSPKQVSFTEGVITISVAPVLKSAAITRQERIKDGLKQRNIEVRTIK